MTLRLLLVTGVAVASVGLTSCGADDDNHWKLIWEEEFNGPAGQSPDPSRWRFDIGTGWGNAQLEYDTDRPVNVSLDGAGSLVIRAVQEQYLQSDYTSGRINTRDYFDHAYGRFEARIRLPIGQGLWPAFWLLGSNFDVVGWPACGEIDIMEYRGQEPSIVHGSLHGPGYAGGQAVTGSFTLGGATFDQDFHVFGVEWFEDRVTWTIDGTAYQAATRATLPAGAPWVFDHAFFIILNVAVGGHFVGPPDGTTTFPQEMLIDWVRVYEWGP